MKIAILGGGPAGLRAAEVAAAGGASVTLFDAKASVGRKLLVAGRGGLNLTKVEPRESFTARYSAPAEPSKVWPSLIAEFDPDALRAWAAGLGVETFLASTGRVYPRELKAAPLLRRWVRRLRDMGVHFAMRHRWTGLQPGAPLHMEFEAVGEHRTFATDAAILALGGGSWPETGSDGAWTAILEQLGVSIAPLAPANCGWEFPWPPAVLAAAEGHPLKSIAARAGAAEARGELLITRYGLEGGALYQLGPALRAMSPPLLFIDFKPAFTLEALVARMGPIRRNFLAEARQRWKLSDAAFAILSHSSQPALCTAESLASWVKAFPLRLTRPRPLVEAISSAGGVRWSALDRGLMLRHIPGLFAAGEMIDWEAPTGGYLLQGCLATGTRAANAALAWLRDRDKATEVP